MDKKAPKKLLVNRETIRNLDEKALARIAGGTSFAPQVTPIVVTSTVSIAVSIAYCRD